MMTIQKPKRMWQKKKDYMRNKTIRGLRRKGKRILQSFDDGTDDNVYLYGTPEQIANPNTIWQYPEAKDGPVITSNKGNYENMSQYISATHGSAYDPNAPFEMFNQLVFNSAPSLLDTAYQSITGQYGKQYADTPTQDALGTVYKYIAPSRWAGSIKSTLPGYKFEYPWGDGNPGLTGDSNLDGIFDMLVLHGIGDSTRFNNAVSKSKRFIKDQMANTFPVFDEYTTKNGAFGYYGGSTASRAIQSILRQANLGSARMPELIRSEKGGFRIPYRLTQYTGRFPWANFTTEHVVRDHIKGKWKGSDVVVTDPNIINPKHYLSVDPSDTFIANGEFIDKNPSAHTLISGDVDLLTNAKMSGMETLSSPKLRKLFSKMIEEENKSDHNTIGRFSFAKTGREYTKTGAEYTNEINRLLRKRGAPLYKDYKLQSKQTGLPIQVFKTKPNLEKYVRAYHPFYYLTSSPVENRFRSYIGMGPVGLEQWAKYTKDQLKNPNFLRNILDEYNQKDTNFKLPNILTKDDIESIKSAYSKRLHNSGKDIHIKKANRGKFTEAANEHNMGVQEFARQVLSAPKGKYSSTLRKRANFARNFAH